MIDDDLHCTLATNSFPTQFNRESATEAVEPFRPDSVTVISVSRAGAHVAEEARRSTNMEGKGEEGEERVLLSCATCRAVATV